MLATTNDLITYLSGDKVSRDSTLTDARVHVILNFGTKEDADRLLPVFLSEPFGFYHSLLLPLFQKFGDLQTAESLFNACIVSDKLNENAFPEVLEIMGALKYEPVKAILVHYALNPETGYDTSKYAVSGLLNFDCSDIQQAILNAIEACYGRNVFPEFVPALVCKLDDKAPVLATLYELGKKGIPSTDCIGGIIQAFSLCGKEGESYFKSILFDPDWESVSSGTGNAWQTYHGMQRLNISFKDLYAVVKALDDPAEKAYALDVLLCLLEIKVTEQAALKDPEESFMQLYESLYSWKNENGSDNLVALATTFGKQEEAYKIEALLKLKIYEELILKNLANK